MPFGRCPNCGEPEHPDQCTLPARTVTYVAPMSAGVRSILETIVAEMEGCKARDGSPCDDHVVRFGADDLIAAKAALKQ